MASNIRGLSSLGVELTVVALNTVKHRVSTLPQNGEPKHVTWYPIQVDTTPTPVGALANLISSGQSYMVSRFDIPEVHNTLDEILKESKFDAAIIDGLFMMPYADQVKAYNIPIALRAHNVEHQIWERHIQRETSSLKKWYLNLQNQRLKKFEVEQCKIADVIVPITDDDATWFSSQVAKDQLHTMPCGINPTNYPEYPSVEPDIFHIGAMDWMPNVDGINWFAEEVWKEITSLYPEAVFHLAGNHSDELNLHQPNSGFFVHGRVESSNEFFSKHGIFIVPLHSGSGMRIKVLEAMSYGKAIVSTSIGVEGIPVKDGVDVLIADDAKQFAAAVVQLLKNKDLRLELGANARANALQNFNEEKLASKLLQYLVSRL